MSKSLICGTVLAAFVSVGIFTTPVQEAAAKDAVAKEKAAQPGDTITWMLNVPEAFKKAKETRKVLLICINSKTVDGKAREEPAAKGLREVVYKNLQVVTKSREFVCVFLTPAAGGEDYGELRHRFGLDGQIVSPQHIFAHPDHSTGKPLLRMEYWSYGKDAPAVKQLLSMMGEAQAKYSVQPTLPDAPVGGAEGDAGEAPVQHGAPDVAAARAEWIKEMLGFVSGGDEPRRKQALVSLVTNDKEGDCLKPLAELLPTLELVPQQRDVMRTLGRDKLFVASAPIEAFLTSKDPELRGIAAVSLEYIGNPESVKLLNKRVGKERVESVQNHMARALGRCGKGDAKVRAKLAKLAAGGKTEMAGMGAVIGLAYFEKDAKAARSVEKLLKKMGVPSFGRRGGNMTGTARRAMLAWTLAEIGDPKSADFMTKEFLEPLRNIKNRWMNRITDFYGAVVEVCRGKAEAKADVVSGAQRSMEWGGGAELKDDARKERDTANFTPKADWDISPGGMGGGRGGRGGGGGGGRGD